MENIFEKEHHFKGAADKLELDQAMLISRDPKHGGLVCDHYYKLFDHFNGTLFQIFFYFIILENYDCADYENYFDEVQEEMDYAAGYYGCAFDLCGMTAGDEYRVENSGVNNFAATAPLFLTVIFWLFK